MNILLILYIVSILISLSVSIIFNTYFYNKYKHLGNVTRNEAIMIFLKFDLWMAFIPIINLIAAKISMEVANKHLADKN